LFLNTLATIAPLGDLAAEALISLRFTYTWLARSEQAVHRLWLIDAAFPARC